MTDEAAVRRALGTAVAGPDLRLPPGPVLRQRAQRGAQRRRVHQVTVAVATAVVLVVAVTAITARLLPRGGGLAGGTPGGLAWPARGTQLSNHALLTEAEAIWQAQAPTGAPFRDVSVVWAGDFHGGRGVMLQGIDRLGGHWLAAVVDAGIPGRPGEPGLSFVEQRAFDDPADVHHVMFVASSATAGPGWYVQGIVVVTAPGITRVVLEQEATLTREDLPLGPDGVVTTTVDHQITADRLLLYRGQQLADTVPIGAGRPRI